MKRALAVAILPAVAVLLVLGSVVGIILRAGDDDDKKPVAATTVPSAPVAPPPPAPVSDACSVLPADSVARALGLPAGRLRSMTQRINPEQGARCNYQDTGSNMYIFFLHVQDVADPATAREELEAFTGTPVDGLGDVARYDQGDTGDTTINAIAGARTIFLGTRAIRVPQEAMVGLAREVLGRR